MKKPKPPRPNCCDIEIAVAKHFRPRVNLAVPNVSWGLGLHECDMLVLTASGYAYEVEIKVSKADLIKDAEKSHGHRHSKIKRLYFAIPEHLEPHIEHIPARAGILMVYWRQWRESENYYTPEAGFRVKVLREAENTGCYKFKDHERETFFRLGALRILGLKERLRSTQKELQCLKNQSRPSA